MMANLKSFRFLLPALIKSQFIENPHDFVRVGDELTLKCLIEESQESKDVANYVWYLNSESREILLIFLFHNRRDLFHFYFFSSCIFFSFILHRISDTRRLKLMMLTDKKVINNEHFVQKGNELTINNAVEHLSGNYSCVVEFLNSGAKLRTPHELIKIVGEYHFVLSLLHSVYALHSR